MATYYVNSNASGANDGSSWTDAYTSIVSAISAATTAGDIIKVHKTHKQILSASTTFTFTDGIFVVVVDKDASDALAEMDGTNGYIGNTTTTWGITWRGSAYFYGLYLRLEGTGSTGISLGTTDNTRQEYRKCTFLNSSAGNAIISFGDAGTAGHQGIFKLFDCTFADDTAVTGHRISLGASVELVGCVVHSSGSTMFSVGNDSRLTAIGCDFSAYSGTLFGTNSAEATSHYLANCKLHGSVTVLSGPTHEADAQVLLTNCASGDQHYHLAHYSGLGSTVISTSIYANDNIADTDLSWVVDGSSNASKVEPYMSPWIAVHHTGTAAITPSLEVVRSGSSTAYKDDEVWTDWLYPGTSGSPLSVYTHDRAFPTVTAADQTTGAKGAADWTGENATSWFGKLAPPSSITPAEAGPIMVRVCVGGDYTVYVDPQIRGLA
jgi:hypothetical protein